MVAPKIDISICERLVTTVLNHCSVATAVHADASENRFDAISASFSALSVALTWGAIILAVVAVIIAVGWGYLVKVWAEKEAREEAERCANKIVEAHMQKWLSAEAPLIIRRHVDYLRDTSLGDDDDDKAAEDIGKEAG